MNDLVGERISIITSKSQTTRHRITGIVNTPEYQIVFSDTPGVLKPKYKLQESMLEFSEGALTDADILLIVTEWKEFRSPDFEAIAARLARKAIFDGRNMYEPSIVRECGLEYHGIGRL